MKAARPAVIRPVVNPQLGGVLQALRKQLNVSLREVARRSGTSTTYIAQMEAGNIREPSPHTLWRLAMVFAAPGGQALAATYRSIFLAAGYRAPDIRP